MHIAEGSVLKVPSEIGKIFLNSTSFSDFAEVGSAAASNSSVKPFFGLHPWKVEVENTSDSIIKDKLKAVHTAGIGECGLDFRPKFKHAKSQQIVAFETQLDLCRQYARPVSIHCVKAWEQLFISLKRFTPLPAPFILHSFYGPEELIRMLISLGGFISLSAISLRNPDKSSSTIKTIPEDKLLIETDIISGSQSFTIDKHLKILENNYTKISEIRSVSEEKLRATVWANGTIFTN